jgi:hypothetical protein
MTVNELVDLIIRLGAAVGALTGIVYALRVVIVKPLKSFYTKELQQVKSDSAKVLRQVAPVNGPTLNQRLEQMEFRMSALDQRMTDHILTHQSSQTTTERNL